MPAKTKTTQHRARLRHTCSLCDFPIRLGRFYVRWRWFGPDGPVTVKAHPYCDDRAREKDWHYDTEGPF